MWIGVGVYAIYDFILSKLKNANTSAISATLLGAIVPLIIASQEKQPFFHEALEIIFQISKELNEEIDYTVNKKHKEINLTIKGREYLNKNIFRISKIFFYN
jgi:preprotein translocase subunit SecA